MTTLFALRSARLALGLAVLGGAGWAVHAFADRSSAASTVAYAPVCSSCDARHARLADLAAAGSEELK
ncbi:MAG TPA: hypothetical protein PKA03_15000 [Tabrizicola sp.]|nr:hypothetical protein [Tabrizicola sp.]